MERFANDRERVALAGKRRGSLRRDRGQGNPRSDRPTSSSPADLPTALLALQGLVGNRAFGAHLAAYRTHSSMSGSSRRAALLSPILQRQVAGGAPGRERVIDERSTAERTRTVVAIHVIGHASPRWRGASSPEQADRLNAALSARRAEAVRKYVERELRSLLSERDLVFEYDYTPADPTSGPADVVLGSESRGSSETLTEAGPRGRRANDPSMRRVDVLVTMHQATETDVAREVERVTRRSAATRDWALWVGLQSGAALGAKVGYIMVQLRNRRTGVTATYHGHYSGVEAGASVSFASTGLPDFEPFTTPEPMSFADFDASRFLITSAGIALGIGYSFARFRFVGFNWGHRVPRDAVPISGLSMGGIGITLGSTVYGAMYLQGRPREWEEVPIRELLTETYRSEAEERGRQRVLFDTGLDRITADSARDLDRHLAAVAHRYE